MKHWWLTDIARVSAEKTTVEQLSANEDWFQLSRWWINDFRFSADGVITAHGIDYPVRLIYPDQFPAVPAWVEPQDPDVRWSRHQYGKGGSLCLELRSDNWSSDATGVDVLRSAYNLLYTENPLGSGVKNIVASAHQVGDLQSYSWSKNPVLIGAGCLERIQAGVAVEVRALRWMAEDDIWPIMVFDSVDSSQVQHPPSADICTLRSELPVEISLLPVSDIDRGDCALLAKSLDIDLSSERFVGGCVVFILGENSVLPLHIYNAESVFERELFVLSDETGERSGRKDVGKDKRVAVVGLGSVGSKIAEILLRSGVHRLVLVDGDVMLPGNLERHTLDWRDVGFRKVNAVKRRLQQIVPGAFIDVVVGNLNWQRSARTYANQIQLIADCDLIVNATGDFPTALLLGAIADENQKAFVSTEVFAGGLGCLIARSIPAIDPPYLAGHRAYTAFCEQENKSPPSAGCRTYEALTEDGDPVIADDAAVTMAAAHTARLILDILDDQIEDVNSAWLLFGFRQGWLFKHHGHCISLDVGCAQEPVHREKDSETEAFVIGLAKEVIDAITSPE